MSECKHSPSGKHVVERAICKYCEEEPEAERKLAVSEQALGAGKEIIESLLELIQRCNPQDETLLSFDECPRDHPNCCGVCETRYAARDYLAALASPAPEINS